MNLEFASEPKYIKIDFKNKLILKNDSDIKEETSELEIISKLFQKEVPLEQINSFIDKILEILPLIKQISKIFQEFYAFRINL